MTDCGPRMQFRSPASPVNLPSLPPPSRPTQPILPPSPRFALSSPAVRTRAAQSISHREMQILHTSLVLMEIESSFKTAALPCRASPSCSPHCSFSRVFSEMRVGPCVSPLGGRRAVVCHCFFGVCYFGKKGAAQSDHSFGWHGADRCRAR